MVVRPSLELSIYVEQRMILLTKLPRKPSTSWVCPWGRIIPLDAVVNDSQCSVEQLLQACAGGADCAKSADSKNTGSVF